MVDVRGDWDWVRLRGLLPKEVLDRIAAYPTPKAHYGSDVPGWRWDDNRIFSLRCSRILDEDFLEREGIYDRGCRLLAECESTFGVTVAPARELHRRQRWVGSARGWVKLNVDAAVGAAVGATDDRASVGGVIRDANGEWMFGFSRFVGRCPVLLAELWAVLDGLRHAWAVNYRRVELETDNKEDWVVVVKYAPRECNGVADSLAALGRDSGWQGSTFSVPPGAIVHRLDVERQQWLSTRPVQCLVDDPGG
ncbi:hypothetical protein V6N11_065382 [Hibiscus sabdariffa]|uniref:RNase H type-1 domain-containing protein n=1 Tax=Hibiscus sabdariffa TaxID=183260 RepID=A0ABR1ZS23_9ROSI